MKLITRHTDYAIRALSYMSCSPSRIVSAVELVEKLKIPRPFLRKILQALNKRGIVKSFKGKYGGFLLATEAKKIYILDLIEIFQQGFRLNECIFKKDICPDIKRCQLRRKISSIEKKVFTELKRITIASIVKGERNGKAKNN